MANVYIKTAEGGETTSPVGTEGIPLDDGVNSTWISINNIAEYIRQTLSASTTGAVVGELATSAETDTGTDTTRVVTPDGFAGSVFGKKTVFCLVSDSSTTPATGDGKVHFMISPELNGMNLVDADAVVTTVSSSGTPTFAVRRERSGSAVDMLSTNITIDQSEKTSYTAATAPVINTSNDDVATGDIIYIDLDTIGTGAKGHGVILSFQLP